jgi:hypothetical protein
MKLHGVKPEANVVTEVFTRPNGNIVFKMRPVIGSEDFVKLCPEPVPPRIVRAGIGETENVEDPDYKAAVLKHNGYYFNWMILQSLDATPGLEWETVDRADPETWGNYRKELSEANMSEAEIGRLVGGVLEANGLDSDKIDRAKKAFLAQERELANAKS